MIVYELRHYPHIYSLKYERTVKSMAGTTQYKNNWQREKLDRISLTVPKGRKEQIQSHASASSSCRQYYLI